MVVSKSVSASHRLSIALVALAVANAAAPLIAESLQSQLNVSVIVARSCVVDVQPVVGGAPRLRLACAAGAGRDVRVIESTRAVAPAESDAPRGGVPVLLVNF
jgi:hypothetical protein